MMGIKKVATLCFCCSVAWPPIQIPKINAYYHSARAAVIHAYPLLRTGYLFGWRFLPRHFTLYLPQDRGSNGISTRDRCRLSTDETQLLNEIPGLDLYFIHVIIRDGPQIRRHCSTILTFFLTNIR